MDDVCVADNPEQWPHVPRYRGCVEAPYLPKSDVPGTFPRSDKGDGVAERGQRRQQAACFAERTSEGPIE